VSVRGPSPHAPTAVALLALILAPLPAPQEPAAPAPGGEVPAQVRSPEALIDAVYGLVSFPAGEVPDWDAVRALMLPQALIVQPAARGRGVRPMDVDGFVQVFVDDIERLDMSAVGFQERVVSKQVTQFGDVASALVVFEARMLAGPGATPQRGLDCFHLVRQDGRWWIASIATQFAVPGDPIPEQLLPADER
jgi:hypothetical protein